MIEKCRVWRLSILDLVLLKAFKYTPEQRNDFDCSKQRRFYITDKQSNVMVNKLVYSTDSLFLSQNITQLIITV